MGNVFKNTPSEFSSDSRFRSLLMIFLKTIFTISVFSIVVIFSIWAINKLGNFLNKERVELNKEAAEDDKLYQMSKDHFIFLWYDAKKQLEKKHEVDLIDKKFIVAGERQYQKLLSVFEVQNLPKIAVYINPPGQDEEFRYVAGFESSGKVYLKEVDIDISKTLSHELVHALEYYTIDNKIHVPSWFKEGIAQYYSEGGSEISEFAMTDFLVKENKLYLEKKGLKANPKDFQMPLTSLAEGQNPNVYFALTANDEYRKGKDQSARFYKIAYELTNTLVQKRGGEEKLKELLLTMKKGYSLETSFRKIYNMTPNDLWDIWSKQ